MDKKIQSQTNSGAANGAESIVKTTDVSKYNLRCNRSLSEKMTKKDFVYDIRRPLQTAKKVVDVQKNNPTSVPNQLYRSKTPKITIRSSIVEARYIAGGGDATMQYPVHRILNFECNLCHEQIATRFSLSTHVKFHRRKYCKMCYWIFHDGETMEEHLIEKHMRVLTPISAIPVRYNRV